MVPYQSILHEMYQLPGNLVAGLLLYADKTHTEILGRFKLEPLVGTISLFRNGFLLQKVTKFLISYLIDLELKSSAKSLHENTRDSLGGVNIRNYHRQLHAALAGVREIQQGIQMRI